MLYHMRRSISLLLAASALFGIPTFGQQVIANGPNGPICTGPLGNGPCTDVVRYLQQHPGMQFVGYGPAGPMCNGPLGPGPCVDVARFIEQRAMGGPAGGGAGPAGFVPVAQIGNSPQGPVCAGPLGPGLCADVAKYLAQHPVGSPLPPTAPQFYVPQTFTATGADAQRIGIQCATQSQGELNAFVSCAGQQMVLPEKQQILVDCAARSGGTVSGLAACAGQEILGDQLHLNPEQHIAIDCVVQTGGQPYAAAACTATQLTARELSKCVTNGIGGRNGCFGDNNDLVGRNGWTVRSFNNVINDIQHGPGPTNDLVGSNGFVVRTAQNMQNDIRNGPGRNNDLVGCNGWVNTHVFGGSCH